MNPQRRSACLSGGLALLALALAAPASAQQVGTTDADDSQRAGAAKARARDRTASCQRSGCAVPPAYRPRPVALDTADATSVSSAVDRARQITQR